MIETGTAQFWRATLALCLGSFMIFSNVYVTQPLLPMLSTEFAVSPLQASWSMTVTTLTLGVSLLLFGPLSDAIGRTRLMVLSMCGVVLCSFALSLVEDFTMLILLRAVQGICLAGLPAIAIAYMGDEFSKKALAVAVGIYISGNTLGGIGGRLIGGFVGDWLGWQEAFAAMSLVSLICLSLFVWLLPASEHFSAQPVKPGRMLRDMLSHLRNPLLLLAYLIGGFNFFIFINQYSYATFLLAGEPYQLPASLLGMLFLTYLSGTLGSALSGRFVQLLPQPLVIAAGCAVLMVGSLLTLIPALWAIVLGFLVNAFGFFVAHSSASSWVSQRATHARATASSIYLVFYYLGASSGGFYLDPFWRWAGWQGIVIGSLCVLALTLSLALTLHLKTRSKPLVVAAVAG
ncbi:MFS transporter [Neptuniibacter halophilus]|uniref:MFS transporter n=1 Tax=Neptuniibacter halophilus TaxID=651666 RepID=UPI00257305CA|nr:MFS transporter [Neptuniibacter halophilus]